MRIRHIKLWGTKLSRAAWHYDYHFEPKRRRGFYVTLGDHGWWVFWK